MYLLLLKIHNIWVDIFWHKKRCDLNIDNINITTKVTYIIVFNKTVYWYKI